MDHTAIGTATINGQVTTIRKYKNGFYVVEFNGTVMYQSNSLADLERQLNDANVTHSIVNRI